jgi:hypothetical protein
MCIHINTHTNTHTHTHVSASASEFVAAALVEGRGSTLVGSHSRGKAKIQGLFPLSEVCMFSFFFVPLFVCSHLSDVCVKRGFAFWA